MSSKYIKKYSKKIKIQKKLFKNILNIIYLSKKDTIKKNYTYIITLIKELIISLNKHRDNKFRKYFTNITEYIDNNVYFNFNYSLYIDIYDYIFNILYDNIEYFHKFMNIFIEIILKKDHFLLIFNAFIKINFIDYKNIIYNNIIIYNLTFEIKKTYKFLFLVNYFIINDKKQIFDNLILYHLKPIDIKEILNNYLIDITKILNNNFINNNLTDLTDFYLIELRKKINEVLINYEHFLRYLWISITVRIGFYLK